MATARATPSNVASPKLTTVSIVVGRACCNRISEFSDNTPQTAEGGGSSTGEIRVTRHRISQAMVADTAKPSGKSTLWPILRHPPGSLPTSGTGVGVASCRTDILYVTDLSAALIMT